MIKWRISFRKIIYKITSKIGEQLYCSKTLKNVVRLQSHLYHNVYILYITIWNIVIYEALLYMKHCCIWNIVVYETLLYMKHCCRLYIWNIVVYETLLYMKYCCIWNIVVYEILLYMKRNCYIWNIVAYETLLYMERCIWNIVIGYMKHCCRPIWNIVVGYIYETSLYMKHCCRLYIWNIVVYETLL
jgi:hypothetical protein